MKAMRRFQSRNKHLIYPTVAWEPWRGAKEDSNIHDPPEGKTGPQKPGSMKRTRSNPFNTYALPVIRYPASIVSWTKEEMEAADVKFRKLLTMYESFHRRSNVERLYKKVGGAWCASKPPYWMKPRTSRSTSARWHPKTSCSRNVLGNSRQGPKNNQRRCSEKKKPCMGCTTDR